jgi:tetratricopeptide (TPR) repeat protein
MFRLFFAICRVVRAGGGRGGHRAGRTQHVPIDTSAYKEKARIAVDRRNYPDAIAILQEVLVVEPNDVEARRTLRAVEMRAVKEAGTSRSVAVLKHLGTYLKLMFPSKNYDQVIVDCEKYLVDDPTNPGILRKLAVAAHAAGYNDTAVAVLEDLRAQNPKDVTTMRLLQEMYQALGNIPKALDVNKAILQIVPGDREASQAVRDLSAADMAGKFQEAAEKGEAGKTARAGLLKDTQEADRLARILRTEDDVAAEIEDLKKDIASKQKGDRNLPNLHVKLGNLYLRIKRYDDAASEFDMAHELSPTEYTIVMKQQDVEIRRSEDRVKELQAAAKQGGESDKAAYRQAYNDLMKYKLECFVERERQFPTDLGIAFELANIYFAAQKYDEAIKRYQRTVNDPKNRLQSLLNLGIAFQKKGQTDLAIHRFTEGANAIEYWNDMKKALLYQRADCYEQMGEKEKAIADFTAIYETDIAYRDVARRLEKLRGRG